MATLKIFEDKENYPNGLNEHVFTKKAFKNKGQVLGAIQQKQLKIQTRGKFGDSKIHQEPLCPIPSKIPRVVSCPGEPISKEIPESNCRPPQEAANTLNDSVITVSSSSSGTPMSITPPTASSSSRSLNDLFDVCEYQEEIYAYLQTLEREHRPKPNYMNKQNDISLSMRRILVDWLVSVSEEYNMHAQTLHLAVLYIDRFLSYMSVVKSKLQLVGTAAMVIASKFEEVYPPTMEEFVYLTDDTYTPLQLRSMEKLILKILKFDLSSPTTLTFIEKYSRSADLSTKGRHLAMYLSELILLEGDQYLTFLPSQLAAAAVALARHTLEEEEMWTPSLEIKSGYSLKELSPIIRKQHRTFVDSPTNQQVAITEKYAEEQYDKVALLKPRVLALDHDF